MNTNWIQSDTETKNERSDENMKNSTEMARKKSHEKVIGVYRGVCVCACVPADAMTDDYVLLSAPYAQFWFFFVFGRGERQQHRQINETTGFFLSMHSMFDTPKNIKIFIRIKKKSTENQWTRASVEWDLPAIDGDGL